MPKDKSADPLAFDDLDKHQVQNLISQRDNALKDAEEARQERDAHRRGMEEAREERDATIAELEAKHEEAVKALKERISEVEHKALEIAREADATIQRLKGEIEALGGTDKAQELQREERRKKLIAIREQAEAELAELKV